MMNNTPSVPLSNTPQSRPRYRSKRSIIAGIVLLVAIAGCTFFWLPMGQAGATNAAVAFANANWNCRTAACTSRVSAGSAQPDYQCAEFVARSLAAEGEIPGLTAHSSQSAYGNYHAHNGRTYDLLWVGWAYGGWSGNGLYQYLTQNGVGTNIGNNPSKAVPGDVTIYFEGEGHTGLLVQTGSDPLVDAHNNARYHVYYTEGYSLTIVHIGKVKTPPPSTADWPVEQYGSTGRNVVSAQLMLRAHGYSLTADGSFGSITEADVKSYQRAHGLVVDGIVGPKTWSSLIVTTAYGKTGSAVLAVQDQLRAHGYSLTADGSYGPITQSDVKNYQSHHGLSVDGVAGPLTWKSLLQ